MMIGVLDPALLLPRPGEEDRLEAELDDILRICRKGNVVLPTFEEYWPALWKDLGTALQRTLSNPRTRRALDELRRLGRAPAGIPPFLVPQGRNRVYGLLPMFDIPELGAAWLAKMTTTLARASSSSVPSILLTRRMDGRNIEAHQAEDSRIEEVTRWVLYLHLSGSPARAVYCIVGYGGPPGEKAPGEIHHTGQKKKGRLLDDTGWTC